MTEETKTRARKAKPKAPATPKYEVVCAETDHLKNVGFDMSWLDKLAKQYEFTKFQYMHKFRAFRCYQGDRHVDWIDINDVALLNGHRRLEEIRLKHQPLSPKRAIIKYPWR